MTIQLTPEGVRDIFPRAPQAIVDAFVQKQSVLDAVGITHTRPRLSVALSQCEHETAGFTIKDLTENINYSAEGAARVWPSRFPGGADQVRAKYGTARGWQLKLIDDVYGGRMGNRPGTDDGSKHIGRGGPQITGRDGYQNIARLSGVAIDRDVTLACRPDLQPEMLAAFWAWKNFNPIVDAGGLKAATKVWNGGYIGMADREHMMAGNDPIIARLQNVDRVVPIAKTLPGDPPTSAPPKAVTDEATKTERKSRNAAVAGGVAGAANEGAKKTGTIAPDKAPLSSTVAFTLVGCAVVAIVIIGVLIARKKAAVIRNWF